LLGTAATNTTDLAYLAAEQGNLARAEELYEQSVALARQAGATLAEIEAQNVLVIVARNRGDLALAEHLGRDILVRWPNQTARRYVPFWLESLARTAAASGDTTRAVRAARLLGAAAALRVELAYPLHPRWLADIERAVAATQATLGEEAWAAAYAAGSALSPEEAIAEALETDA
jgi:hypothetical protein